MSLHPFEPYNPLNDPVMRSHLDSFRMAEKELDALRRAQQWQDQILTSFESMTLPDLASWHRESSRMQEELLRPLTELSSTSWGVELVGELEEIALRKSLTRPSDLDLILSFRDSVAQPDFGLMPNLRALVEPPPLLNSLLEEARHLDSLELGEEVEDDEEDSQEAPPPPPVDRRIWLTAGSISDQLVDALAKEPELLYDLPSRRFEELVAELMSREGFSVTLTPATRDGGKDVIVRCASVLGSALYYVECKKYGRQQSVGIRTVRELYGVVEHDSVTGGIIATTSFFSKGALEFQEKVPYRLTLKDFSDLSSWLASSSRRARH